MHRELGLRTFVVGLVTGAQFAASLASRLWSGSVADQYGGKRALLIGLATASLAGLFYLASLMVEPQPVLSVSLLVIGRATMGGAESFIITGGLSWAIAIAGPQNTGRVMSWIGTAMYVAFAIGAPFGSALYAWHGFWTIAFATVVIPAATWSVVVGMRPAAITELQGEAPSPIEVLRAVWVPGIGLALSSVGFGTLTTFAALLFIERGCGVPWLAFTAFSLTFVVARLAFGHLPDRLGGAGMKDNQPSPVSKS